MKREHSKRVCYAERENVRTKCKLLILLLIATGLAACSNDDEVAPVQERPITVTVSEKPFTAPTSNAAPVRSTRAAITTTETFNAFSIDYVYGTAPSRGQRTATKTAGTWNVDGSWPFIDTDNKVNWYAHNDGTFNWDDDEGTQYIYFSVEENAAQQKDLLVSTLSASHDECGGHLNFTFDHACAAIRFYVKKANNLSDYTLKVSSVKLSGVVKAGNYYYNNTPSWTLGSQTSSYTLYDGTSKTLSNSDYEALDATDAPYLFLIPQTLTAWEPSSAPANTYLELACTISKGGSSVFNGTAYIPFGATLDAGTQYDVKINIGKKTLYNNNGDIIITE